MTTQFDLTYNEMRLIRLEMTFLLVDTRYIIILHSQSGL